ncbi:MAG: rRNA pseudouridine synthase [Clostridia bacterium]|nr:rRNA pseudouridine synthase [Clostridia bacterium]
MATERIDRIIASCTEYSRREAKQLIKSGAVTIDGSAVRSSETKADPETAVIAVNGTRLIYKKNIYIMLNKPEGVVSSTDEKGMTTVLDLVDDGARRRGVFPAGRLDRDTTGFVLLTDDGAFAHEILSPVKHVEKTYLVTAQRPLSEKELSEMRAGIEMDGEPLLPGEVRLLADGGQPIYELKIWQGKYHQIKRMFSHFGNRVLALKRTAIGGLPLDPALAPGEWRELTPEEVELIRS